MVVQLFLWSIGSPSWNPSVGTAANRQREVIRPMIKRGLTICLLVGLVGVGVSTTTAVAQDATAALPERVGNFRLADHLGSSHELKRYRDGKAVVLYFTGVGCPVVRKSVPQLKELRDTFGPKGVQFLMVDSNLGETREEIVQEATDYSIDIPVLIDRLQIAAQMLGVKSTGTAVVLDTKTWNVVYRGAIDDRLDVGAEKPAATKTWLVDALNAVLAEAPVPTAQSEARGCLITLAETPQQVSYARDIAPVLAAKCQSCHSDGNIGPFPLRNYDDVKKRARMVGEVVRTVAMPPWDADPHYGLFANDRRLTDDELKKLLAWIDAGAPKDDGPDALAENKVAALPEWELGEPDLVLELPERELPASGVFDYEYVTIPTGLTSDKWIRAVDVQANNRQLMHHILMFVEYPIYMKHNQPDVQGGLEGFFGGYVPGAAVEQYPAGTAKFLPARAQFVLQMHYNATGKSEKVKPRIGLYFAKEEPKVELETRTAHSTEFMIPPNSANYSISAEHVVDKTVQLFSMSPHMHFRGSWFEYIAEYPDGKKEVLLSVPQYKFDWQTRYVFAEPKILPAGTKVICRGGYDNSPRNPFNPNPSAWVQFGEQTYEEMFIGYMDYAAVPDGTQTASLTTGR